MAIALPTVESPAILVPCDALEFLKSLPPESVDAVITDPPYPCIDREYGRWTEVEWFDMMNPIVEECRRVLKPTGSAVFVLQPNSERFGRMRPWLFEFQAKWCREWGMVQDAYWWNYTAMPGDYRGLMRPSVKPCVWLGPPDCYRDMDSVLWTESEHNAAMRRVDRGRRDAPSGRSVNNFKAGQSAARKGGVVAFNLLPDQGCQRWGDGGGAHGHGASTSPGLVRRWVRYICPPGGTVLDPFLGSGTTALAALAEGRLAIGSERFPKYVDITRRRIADALASRPGVQPTRSRMETLFAELASQIVNVHGVSAADAAARVAVIRATARDRGWEWVELAGPAIAATCRALGITPSPRNLDAYTFNNE